MGINEILRQNIHEEHEAVTDYGRAVGRVKRMKQTAKTRAVIKRLNEIKRDEKSHIREQKRLLNRKT